MNEKVRHRMQVINTMLLEMASGNFYYRIERSSKNDNIEALMVTLNMLAEEIQEAIIHQGYANTNENILDTVQMSFVLDAEACVLMVNQMTCNILSRLRDDIIGKPFESFLYESSIPKWHTKWKKIRKRDFYDSSIDLNFKSKGDLTIHKKAHLTTFINKKFNERWTLITIIHHSNIKKKLDSDLKNKLAKKFKTKEGEKPKSKKLPKSKLRLSYEDIRKIRDGHDIIVNNLEMNFPTLKDFALQIGTNEFKLKYGFKELYGTTLHRFLMQERLRKAQMMIQYTDKSIKSIALSIGFKSIPHFSRAFKNRYGYPPSALRKKSIYNTKGR